MILSGTNRIDGREKTLVTDCKNSNPWLFTLSPWPLGVSSYSLSGLPPWLALVSVTQTDTWTGNGLQALSGHPWESYDQIREMSLNQPLGFWEIRGWVNPVVPADFASTTRCVSGAILAHPSHPRPEEPPSSPPPPGSHESHKSQRSVTNNKYL